MKKNYQQPVDNCMPTGILLSWFINYVNATYAVLVVKVITRKIDAWEVPKERDYRTNSSGLTTVASFLPTRILREVKRVYGKLYTTAHKPVEGLPMATEHIPAYSQYKISMALISWVTTKYRPIEQDTIR